jgi:uncharacterized delta-60 repeat protein
MNFSVSKKCTFKFWASAGVLIALILLSVTLVFAAGYLDQSYGPPNGYVILDSLTDSSIQSDDRLLVMQNGHLTRLLTDGSVDTSFGTNGVADPVFGDAHIAVAPDGSIIVANVCTIYPPYGPEEQAVTLVRLLSNGQVDSNFRSVCHSINATLRLFFIQDVVVQKDGKILVMSFNMFVGDGFWGYSILSRYDANGDLDATFANNGIFVPYENLSDIVLQADGAILLSGTIVSSPFMFPVSSVVIRLTPAGQYDPSFGNNGIFIYDQMETNGVYTIALQENGRILVGGQEIVSSEWTGFVLGLTPMGKLDPGFGNFGKVAFPERVGDLILLLDDGFLTGGPGSSTNLIIRRFAATGDAVLNFGNNGTIPFDTFGILHAFHRQRNGQVLFGSDNIIARLDINLTPHYIFEDVNYTYWAQTWIESLYHAGVTRGCGINPFIFCPDAPTTRAEMAVFLLRGEHGSTYIPLATTGNVYSDVPTDHWAAAWIEQLAAEGITSGCGNGDYCPETAASRAQMAVLLLRAKHGSSYTPPPATGIFADVPMNHWAAAWIEQLAAEGITRGCGGGNYCPDAPGTRAQMAVFLVRTFNLP